VKRSTYDGATAVYRYGCPSWADLPDEALRQLRLGHDLYNELVAIDRRYEAMKAALWLSFPRVAAAQAAVDAANQTIEQVTADALAERQNARTTVASRDIKARLAAARGDRRAARDQLKVIKADLKPQMDAVRAELDEARRHAEGKANLYADFVKTRGLGWGTYNDTIDKFRAARSRVREAWKAGQPAELAFRRWTGEGTLTVQVRSTSGALRPLWALEPGRPASDWLGKLRRVNERISDRTRTLRLQIGRTRGLGPYWLELPVVQHRHLPEDAEVRYVRVTRTRTAGQHRLHVTLTARTTSPAKKTTGEAVDVDLRWTSGGPTGGVRVARVSTASGNLPAPPDEVAAHVTSGDFAELWAPAAWRDLLGRDDAIRADRAELLNELRPAVVEALTEASDLAEQVGCTAAQARVMKFAKYDQLATAWPTDHPLAAKLVAWRSRDRHLWEYEAHERQQTIAKRRDLYRKAAAWLCDAARIIAIRDIDIAALRRTAAVGNEDTPQARHGRKQMQYAAPGEFRAALINAAERRGVQVVYYTTGGGA